MYGWLVMKLRNLPTCRILIPEGMSKSATGTRLKACRLPASTWLPCIMPCIEHQQWMLFFSRRLSWCLPVRISIKYSNAPTRPIFDIYYCHCYSRRIIPRSDRFWTFNTKRQDRDTSYEEELIYRADFIFLMKATNVLDALQAAYTSPVSFRKATDSNPQTSHMTAVSILHYKESRNGRNGTARNS